MTENASKLKKRGGPQGFLFSLHLSDEALVLRLLRLLPLARLRLDDVTGLHAGCWSDFFPQRPRHIKRFLRSRFWFLFVRGDFQRTAPMYVLETRRRRIFVRLQSSFHYRLRLALGKAAERRAQLEQDHEWRQTDLHAGAKTGSLVRSPNE